jgi:ribonuclease P protein component
MFPQKNRINTQYFKFLLMNTQVKKKYSENFRVLYLEDKKISCSVVVPKKIVKGSVLRNKTKRRIRAIVREVLFSLGKRGTFLIFLQKSINKKTHLEIKEELKRTL